MIYDRDKLASLGHGPHASSEYGQGPDDTAAFGLTFADRSLTRAFEMALKDAVILAKSQAGRSALAVTSLSLQGKSGDFH